METAGVRRKGYLKTKRGTVKTKCVAVLTFSGSLCGGKDEDLNKAAFDADEGSCRAKLKARRNCFRRALALTIAYCRPAWVVGLIKISTRRFCARPLSVELSATGEREP